MITVEIVQAWSDRQVLMRLELAAGTQVAQAIALAKLADLPADLTNLVGIFSKPCALDYVLQDGDRIEIYRPLLVDPKTQRRGRAQAQKAKQKRI